MNNIWHLLLDWFPLLNLSQVFLSLLNDLIEFYDTWEKTRAIRFMDRLLTDLECIYMGTRGSFLGGKTAGAWSCPFPSTQCWGKECVDIYLHSLNTPPWRGAQLKAQERYRRFITVIKRTRSIPRSCKMWSC